MPDFLNQYWIVIVGALVLVALAVFFFVPRRDPRPPELTDAAPRKPLEPRKPDIVAARRNSFADPSPHPSPPPEAGPAPATAGAPTVAPPAPPAMDPDAGDDLTQMKGVGPRLATKLQALGVTRLAQIAAWSDGDIDRIDAELGAFAGRIRRDDWVTQARLLAAGDRAGFEARFGALG